MKKKKNILLSLNKRKVSELNKSVQQQIVGGASENYGGQNGCTGETQTSCGCSAVTFTCECTMVVGC
ncbi:class I lanthipeptide [Maribacter flavus]|uniref:Uncharacterized protein n=1 Tax=Maribacter flavus TaxID=1658664 RepID=A0A5B2TVX7_9FLAO|nr:class I lanthipeptide [Maribacter flavus]KAA2218524.1 hypothetical protein F0361_02565 [Maribacter flavus]